MHRELTSRGICLGPPVGSPKVAVERDLGSTVILYQRHSVKLNTKDKPVLHTAIELDHAATPAHPPAVGATVLVVDVVFVGVVEVWDEAVEVVEARVDELEGAAAPPVKAFFAEISYRAFASPWLDSSTKEIVYS